MSQSLYDAAGRLVQSVDPLGNVTLYHYDGLGRIDFTAQPEPVEDGERPISQTVYDAVRNLSHKTHHKTGRP